MNIISPDILLVLIGAFIPGILWVVFFYRKDTIEPEPRRMVITTFLGGMICIIPAILLEIPFGEDKFIKIVIAAPVIEESIKFLAIRSTLYNHRQFKMPLDGITYSATLALGFASAENAYFIIVSYIAPQMALGQNDPVWALGMLWKLFLLRAFLTVPGHAIWSSMWGYALGWSKYVSGKNALVVRGLTISILLHGLFNYFVITHPIGAVGMLILVPVMWRMLYNRMESALSIRYGKTPGN